MQPKKFVIRKMPSSAPAPSYYQPQPPPNQESHGVLCFWLGVLFGPFGLLLAAIVGKAAGLVKALLGFVLVGIPLTALSWWILAVVVPEQQRRARMREYQSYQSEGYSDLISADGRPVRGK